MMLRFFFEKFRSKLNQAGRFLCLIATWIVLALNFPVRRFREKRFQTGPPPETILISFFGRGLGDCLYFSGVLKAIRGRFPNARIELAILKQFEPYFHGNPFVDEILSCPDYYRSLTGFFQFLGSAFARRRKGRADVFIDLLANLFFMPALWTLGIQKRYSIGIGDLIKCWFYDTPVPIHWEVHFYDALAEGLRPLGIPRAEPEFWIPFRSAAPAFLKDRVEPKSAVILAPGGRRNIEAPKTYCWAFTDFSEIILELTSRGYPVILTGAPYDLEFTKNIKPHPLLTDLVGKTSLLEVFPIVKTYARLVVCNNSGLLHIASILGVPSVSYADSQENMVRWRAYDTSKKHIFLQDQPEEKVTPKEFLSAILKQLESGQAGETEKKSCKKTVPEVSKNLER